MTLPTFAAEHRAVALLLLSAGACCRRSISLAQGRSAANLPHAAAAVDRWDRQMNGWMLDHFIDPAPHAVWAVSIKCVKL